MSLNFSRKEPIGMFAFKVDNNTDLSDLLDELDYEKFLWFDGLPAKLCRSRIDVSSFWIMTINHDTKVLKYFSFRNAERRILPYQYPIYKKGDFKKYCLDLENISTLSMFLETKEELKALRAKILDIGYLNLNNSALDELISEMSNKNSFTAKIILDKKEAESYISLSRKTHYKITTFHEIGHLDTLNEYKLGSLFDFHIKKNFLDVKTIGTLEDI